MILISCRNIIVNATFIACCLSLAEILFFFVGVLFIGRMLFHGQRHLSLGPP